ncbi:MAG TPA: sigma factor-like helix-turn-helix DNA-binding protein [Labilithrix sp.]|nr:sigma factor-like helix-turn-helix DNA-binding protein [Labilithrix sp.]
MACSWGLPVCWGLPRAARWGAVGHGPRTDDKRETFVLFEVEQMSMSEVAEIMECPLQTAYSRHRAAREHVLAFFKRVALAEGGRVRSGGGE